MNYNMDFQVQTTRKKGEAAFEYVFSFFMLYNPKEMLEVQLSKL